MSITKRGKVWRIHFFTPNGQEIRVSSGTEDRQTAQELHDDMKRRAWRDAKLGDKLTMTWESACIRWFEEKADKKSIEDDRSRARWLNTHLSGMYLNDITSDVVQELAKKKQLEASDSTVNRHLQLLRAILRRAEIEWKWLEKAPQIKLFKEEKSRLRWLTPEQARKLLDELPPHLKALATLALSTGQRQANILELEWNQVNLEKRSITLQGSQTKNGKPLGVPLNDSAMAVIESLRGVHSTHVFSYKGHPIKQASTRAWYKALKRAGITNFRWHDLRACWASWHVQGGTPIYDLQILGGWESQAMLKKYAHLDVSHLQKHAAALPKL